MFNVTVIDTDGDEHMYEYVQGWHTPYGCLILNYPDNSATVLAQGSWQEAIVSPITPPIPQVPIEDGSVYGEQL